MALQTIPDVEAINVWRKLALLNTGDTIPVSLRDEDGDETEDPEDAVSFTTDYIAGVGSLEGHLSSFTFSKRAH